MREELSLDYDISIDKMVEFTPDEVKFASDYGFELSNEQFYSAKDDKYVHILLLRNFDDQIFKMNDGLYILEACPDEDEAGGIVYYKSNELKDLV